MLTAGSVVRVLIGEAFLDGLCEASRPGLTSAESSPSGAEGNYLSAGKKLIDTKHPAFKAVTVARGRATAYVRGTPYVPKRNVWLKYRHSRWASVRWRRVNLGAAAEAQSQQAVLVFQQHAGLVGGALRPLVAGLVSLRGQLAAGLAREVRRGVLHFHLGNAVDRTVELLVGEFIQLDIHPAALGHQLDVGLIEHQHGFELPWVADLAEQRPRVEEAAEVLGL